ncbi:hypothetical protein [Natrinema sp. 1APR25-10V2]|uniref:hypothetical protein n=1 Tax=Natrinema sp. 1APR25-10V2 TaxID=2951081 RepID=UPI0028770391|nr:hypothetical protein [Natrinema sp. 1APR25-10V2]MDS0476872.1 hypothetical protein [Natrinema sp. 1APR25-10V2]
MSQVDDPRPPLPDWVTDAYTLLSSHMADTETGDGQCHVPAINRAQTVDILCDSDELAVEPEDADYAITRLLERGYFYAVGDELRVTLPSEER